MSSSIYGGQWDTEDLKDAAVTTEKINNGAVTNAKMASDSVDTSQIVNSAVTTAKINNSAVTTGKINNSAVTTGKINNSAVTTAKINNSAVTNAKLASNAVENANVANLAIRANNIDTRMGVSGSLFLYTTGEQGGFSGIFRANGPVLLVPAGGAITYRVTRRQTAGGAITAQWRIRCRADNAVATVASGTFSTSTTPATLDLNVNTSDFMYGPCWIEFLGNSNTRIDTSARLGSHGLVFCIGIVRNSTYSGDVGDLTF